MRQQVSRADGRYDPGRSWKNGMKVNVVTLDFPSLIERIAQKFNYEAAIT